MSPRPARTPRLLIGLIADTHGLLRPEALQRLQGVDATVHAGDIGDATTGAPILESLGAIAPLTAVRGNNDSGDWADLLPTRATLTMGSCTIEVVHIVGELMREASRPAARVVISGHSHRPGIEHHDGVLFVNPGSAGPRRFSLPLSVGRLCIEGDTIEAQIIEFTAPPVPGSKRRG